MLYELVNPAFIPEIVFLAITLIVERNSDASIKERKFPQAMCQRIETKYGCFENVGIRSERYFRTSSFGRSGLFQITIAFTTRVALLVYLPVTPDFQRYVSREGVYDRNADAMQPTRNLVGIIVELTTSVQHRHHDFRCCWATFMPINGNSTPVIQHRDRIVDMDRNRDRRTESGERFIN